MAYDAHREELLVFGGSLMQHQGGIDVRQDFWRWKAPRAVGVNMDVPFVKANAKPGFTLLSVETRAVANENIDLMMNIAGEWEILTKTMDGIYASGIVDGEALLDVLSGHEKTLSVRAGSVEEGQTVNLDHLEVRIRYENND
tara:strand:- start:408 stop:833 length:426 start_codon:yes stop_codon:yes gene_type:complete